MCIRDRFSSAHPVPYPIPQQKFGSEFFGYFGGGYNPSSVKSEITRIDFNNDTVLSMKRSGFQVSSPAIGTSNRQIKSCFGIANKNSAYWGGGTNQVGSEHSVIFRLDFANDSVQAVNTGTLSYNGQQLSAVGNLDFGYINGDSKSKVDRLDYSNDGASTSPKGNLSQTRSRLSATGNTSYGYVVGGEGSNDNGLSTVDRIDFASDTSTAATKGPLTYTARGYSGFSARANALPQ